MSCPPTPAPPLGDHELLRALFWLDRPDRIQWQVAGLLAYRRPAGADRLIAELGGGSWQARGARLLARVWPLRRPPVVVSA